MKFDGRNFPVWSRLILIVVGSREMLEHLKGDEDPPKPTDPKFKAWQAADYTVFSWLIQNMEQKIVVQFAQHQTAKAMWKSLVTTFGVRADPLQVYDLEIKTAKITQGNKTLEEYYSDLQNLWVNTDARKPCPYDCCDKANDCTSSWRDWTTNSKYSEERSLRMQANPLPKMHSE